MARKVEFSSWQERRRASAAALALPGQRRAARRRPRDPEEREILLRLDQARRARWERTGRLVRLGPRRYRIDTSVAP